MTKATVGERWVLRHLMKMHVNAISLEELRDFDSYAEERKIAKAIDDHAARERAKVAEDVLAMADADVNIPAAAYYSLEKNVRAKYGKAKR